MMTDKFLEKEARFKDIEEKLNEFINSWKSNDVVESKKLHECPAPTADSMPFDFKEVNNNDESENIKRELEETDCSEDYSDSESNENTISPCAVKIFRSMTQ